MVLLWFYIHVIGNAQVKNKEQIKVRTTKALKQKLIRKAKSEKRSINAQAVKLIEEGLSNTG